MLFFMLQCFYFMLPAYFANMAPVIVKNFSKRLAIPIDFGKNIVGNNKTYRGLIFGILFAIVIAYFQSLLYSFDFFRDLSFIDYSYWLLLGFLFGFGALFGDLVESFIKRRLNIKPGERFVPWDQIDFVLGALVFVGFVVVLTLKMVLIVVLISFFGHILVNHLAYYFRIRKEKW